MTLPMPVNKAENVVLTKDPMDKCADEKCKHHRYWHNEERVVDEVTPHCSRIGDSISEYCPCTGMKEPEAETGQ